MSGSSLEKHSYFPRKASFVTATNKWLFKKVLSLHNSIVTPKSFSLKYLVPIFQLMVAWEWVVHVKCAMSSCFVCTVVVFGGTGNQNKKREVTHKFRWAIKSGLSTHAVDTRGEESAENPLSNWTFRQPHVLLRSTLCAALICNIINLFDRNSTLDISKLSQNSLSNRHENICITAKFANI